MDKINNCEIPNGYKKSTNGIIPSDWQETNLGSKITVLTDYHANGSYEVLKENVTLLDEENYALMIRTTNFEKKDFTYNVKFIDEHAYNFLKKSKVFPKDIIINKIANAGAVYTMPDLKRKVSLAMNLFLLRTKNCDADYMYFYLKQNECRLRILATGTTTKTITKNDVRSVSVALPVLREQEKIVTVLSTWDKAIELKEELVKQKKTQKKGLMRKLLNGEVIFPGFDGEWKEHLVGDLCELGRGRVISKRDIEVNSGCYPVYSSQISDNGCIGYLNTYDYEGEYITWTTDGANAGTVFYRNGKFNCTNVCGTLRVKNTKIDPRYLVYVLQYNTEKYVVQLGNPKLMNNIMAIIPVLIFDNHQYQSKICDMINTHENTVTLLEKELFNLKLQKKGLMQLLLTGIVRVSDTL